ncbi:MAG: hypothetical protein KBT03_00340 [Bacteroidales bacterium]|nr:hypothetical protein [Candidatus Scybalousia scybalohippi]
MSKQEYLEERLWDLLDSDDPLSSQEVEEVYRISYELGRASVYTESGQEYFED